VEAAEEVEQLGGSPLHDPVALAHVLDPGVLDVRPARIDVDCDQGSRGRTNVDVRRGWEPNARVALGIDPGRFADLLVPRLASLG
jgi:inosine-uridine nucleoside N-ribohydrolase